MNKTVYMPPQHTDDFWTHDAPLFVGTFPSYRNDPRMVQARLHISEEKFRYGKHEIIPLTMQPGETGQRTYVMMQRERPGVVLSAGEAHRVMGVLFGCTHAKCYLTD